LHAELEESVVTRAGGGHMWRAVRDAIKDDASTARFLKILAGLRVTVAVIVIVLAVAIWALSDPASTAAFVAAFRVVIGLLSAAPVRRDANAGFVRSSKRVEGAVTR
jgi:cation transport ATPase